MVSAMKFSAILWGLARLLNYTARKHPEFRERLKERNLVARIMARDEEVGRWYEFRDGKVRSGMGRKKKADVTLAFKNATLGADLLMPPINWLDQINAQKDFKLTVDGPEDLTNWFAQTIMASQSAGLDIGEKMPDGSMRYCNMTNGGPVFVYVKDGKIVRMTPIDLAKDDGASWTIRARGMDFTPPRKTTLAPHGQNAKSIVYSPDRLLYPMKRVDFDPNGERNPQNRGKSGYVRISWQEALDLVGDEIKRLKRQYGPGVMAVSHGSHHTWGNIGYYLSALFRFRNAVGYTQIHHNPDSWEGWYWGAVHHWGYTLRVGQSETYGTVEDCLQNCDMIVFWAADPETTSGSYGAQEGTIRRQWLKNPKLGIKVVHVDPYYNASAQFLPGKWFAPKPTTSVAMAMAIAYVWIKEGLYDKDYVASHTVGFDKWAAYLTGEEDGIAKTPEWQEEETGVPAKDVRALAREWGGKRVYLAPGGWGNGHGGACRNQTGIQWARVMVCLSAMQGLGKPGCNMGNLQWGTPVDFQFYFPGYSEGGMSGDLEGTALPISLYQRMPQLPTMNSAFQRIPRLSTPEAIVDGKAEGYPWIGKSIEHQFARFAYPAPGQAPVKMMYKYGGSILATMNNTNRWVRMYQSDALEFVVNQSIWFEGEAKFADIILPACTNFERVDISRVGGARRLRPSRPAAAQPPRHHLPGAGDQAARRIQVRLLDLQRDLQAARPRQLFLRRHQRDRLGEAALRRVRHAQGDVVEEVHQARLLRRAGREGEAARAGVLPLVLREPQEGRAGGAAAAVGLRRRISQGPADPVRQARVRVQQPQALPRSGAAADRQVRAVMGGPAFRLDVRALSAADADAAFEVQLPHPGRRQGFVPAQHRGPSRQGRRLLLLDHAAQRRRRQGARHQEARPRQGLQRSRRGDLRGAADAAAAARRVPRLRVVRGLRSDGRARQIGRPGRVPQPADARAHADQDARTRSPAPTRWCRSRSGTAASNTCPRRSRGWRRTRRSSAR